MYIGSVIKAFQKVSQDSDFHDFLTPVRIVIMTESNEAIITKNDPNYEYEFGLGQGVSLKFMP